MDAPPEGAAAGSPEGTPGPGGISLEELTETASRGDVLQPELEELFGYEVTPEFFGAWETEAASGSLFTEEDLEGTDNIVILGAELAEIIAEEREDTESLLGMKLLTMQGYQTVTGILPPVSDELDMKFFAPYRNNAGTGGFRRMFMNTSLHFIAEDPGQLEEVSGFLSAWFDDRFGEDRIVISNSQEETEQVIRRNAESGF